MSVSSIPALSQSLATTAPVPLCANCAAAIRTCFWCSPAAMRRHIRNRQSPFPKLIWYWVPRDAAVCRSCWKHGSRHTRPVAQWMPTPDTTPLRHFPATSCRTTPVPFSRFRMAATAFAATASSPMPEGAAVLCRRRSCAVPPVPLRSTAIRNWCSAASIWGSTAWSGAAVLPMR